MIEFAHCPCQSILFLPGRLVCDPRLRCLFLVHHEFRKFLECFEHLAYVIEPVVHVKGNPQARPTCVRSAAPLEQIAQDTRKAIYLRHGIVVNQRCADGSRFLT